MAAACSPTPEARRLVPLTKRRVQGIGLIQKPAFLRPAVLLVPGAWRPVP